MGHYTSNQQFANPARDHCDAQGLHGIDGGGAASGPIRRQERGELQGHGAGVGRGTDSDAVPGRWEGSP